MGSSYAGLFLVTNDSICFAPKNIDSIAEKKIRETLDVKLIKASIYDSALLAIFAKMNNRVLVLPKSIAKKELEVFEKEIKVKLLSTEQAIGNLLELNDHGALVSKSVTEKVIKELESLKLSVKPCNIAGIETTGSSTLATSKGFVMNQNASKEDAGLAKKVFKVEGGFGTANTGDVYLRNSIIANAKGIVAGDLTTGFELNRIEEALEG